MNSDVTIIQSRFHYTEKAYVPNTSNIVVIIDELIKLMEPYFHKQAPTFRLINDIRFEHPETASTYDKIHICCMDTSWSQIAYQFSHEFCHLLIGKHLRTFLFVFHGTAGHCLGEKWNPRSSRIRGIFYLLLR